MMKLVIADVSKAQCDAIRDALKKDFDIFCCTDGQSLPELLCDIQPDILVLDLMLPGRDGVSVLRAAHVAGIRPKVIATSSYVSDYVLHALQGLDVCYVMRKPCALQDLVDRIADIQLQLEVTDDAQLRLDRNIHSALLSLGFIRSKGGYNYIVPSLRAMYHSGNQLAMKELYAMLISTYGGTYTHFEKAIRDSIQKAWKERSETIWRMYFPLGSDGRVACPNNSAFFMHVCAKLLDDPCIKSPNCKAE